MTDERSENVSNPVGRLEIRLLGAPTVQLDGAPVGFRSRKVLALLVFLAVEGGVHRRERLVDLLWPDSEGAKGAATLRSTLSRLRESLADSSDVLQVDGGDVSIVLGDRDVVDVHRLGAMAEGVAMPTDGAGDIPSGRFLDGFGVSGSPDFDDWVARRSAVCQGQQAELFDRRSARALEHGRLAAAEALATGWQSIAPLDDGPVARLVEIDARRGAREAALERYSRHCELLATELDAQPGAALRALTDRVRDGDLAHSSPSEALRRHLGEGRAALDGEDPRGAVIALDQAVVLLDTVGPADAAELTLPVFEARARAQEQCQRFEAARDDYQQLIDRAGDHHDLSWRLRGLVGLAALHATPTVLASTDAATRYAEAAIDLARLLGDADGEARAWWAMLLAAHYGDGDEDAALEHGRRGLAAARSTRESDVVPHLLNDLHWVHAARGDLRSAERTLGEAIECWERLGDQPMLADSLNGAVLLATLRGEFDVATATAARGDELARNGRNLWNQLAINANLGLLRRELGQYDRGISALRAACDVAADGMPAARAYYQLTLAVLLGDLGLGDGVEGLCAQVEAVGIDLPGFWLVPSTVATLRIRTRLQGGTVTEADLEALEAIAAGPAGLSLPAVIAPAVACAAARRLDQPERAFDIGGRHLEAAAAASFRIGAPEVLLTMASARLDLGEVDAAESLLRSSVAASDEMGSTRLGWRQQLVEARLRVVMDDEAGAAAARDASRRALAEIVANVPAPDRAAFEALVSTPPTEH